MDSLLDHIGNPNDIKDFSYEELDILAQEIRDFLIEKVAVTGGHLGSNLGCVELTLALHKVLTMPEDKIIWDVGHQSYTHKLLTGRKEGFETLRQQGGMSGFPKRSESECDAYDTGHSSTSVSAGLGLAIAREINGEDYKVVSVIGDGALTGGMAYEALNNASTLRSNLIIVLNDNNMSISPNVGGMSQHLATLRTSEEYQEFKSGVHSALDKIPYGDKVVRRIRKSKSSLKQLLIPGMVFENIGVTYLGPVDGHNIPDMVRIFREAAKVNGAVVVHVITKKGMGYRPAQRYPSRFHGVGPFDVETGEPKKKKTKSSYTDIFSTIMKKLGEVDEKVVAITAAMADGTGLKRFRGLYPDRFFDVGIAEEHAVTFAAGLATGGMKPVVAIYSSFLQRAYDQIMIDVCMQKLPVIFAVDRAGLVGADGETHQGIFDLSYLSTMPNMTVMAPKNKWELADMMKFALELKAPAAIRYPRGEAYDGLKKYRQDVEYGKSELIYRGDDVAVLAVGSMVRIAEQVRELLKTEGISVTLINARFVKPLDKSGILDAAKNHRLLVTMEENIYTGGFGQQVACMLEQEHVNISMIHVAVPDCFVEHGSVDGLLAELHMDAESVARNIRQKLSESDR